MSEFTGTFEEAAEELAKAIGRSIEKCVSGQKKVAVAFSGGVDSSILVACAMLHTEVIACSAFSEGALDGRKTSTAAEALGVKLLVTRLTPHEVSRELEALDLPFEPSLMDKSLWSLYSIVSRSAAESGAGVILLGQMADELFGGYAKYQAALTLDGEEAAREMMEKDVAEFDEKGRVRDEMACSRWLEPRFPFEANEVQKLGLSMPVSYKIRNGTRKAVLRRAGMILGVPLELTEAPKKAAQYSSGIQKIVR